MSVFWLFSRSLVTRLASSGVQEGLFSPFGANRSVGPVGPLCCDLLGRDERAGPGPGRDPVTQWPDPDHIQSVAAPRSRHIPGTRRPYTRRQVSQPTPPILYIYNKTEGFNFLKPFFAKLKAPYNFRYWLMLKIWCLNSRVR